jgi:hypothetical protein
MQHENHRFLFEIAHEAMLKAYKDDTARGELIKAVMNNVRDTVNDAIDKIEKPKT